MSVSGCGSPHCRKIPNSERKKGEVQAPDGVSSSAAGGLAALLSALQGPFELPCIVSRIIIILVCVSSSALLVSCGRPHSAGRSVRAAVSADMVVTFNGPKSSCAVSRPGDKNKQSMPCLQVPAYLAKTLKMPRGSFFEFETIPDVNPAEFDRVMSELNAEGYRLTPGMHVNFITEPKPRS